MQGQATLFTESKLGLLQYSDAQQRKGLLMAPLSPRDVMSCHVELFTFSRQCSQHCLFIYLLDYGTCQSEKLDFQKKKKKKDSVMIQ